MAWIVDAVRSSVGKKFVMGALGLALCGFLTTHLLGNLLVLLGRETFNAYAEHLESFPLLIPVEIGLLGVFLLHILVGVILTVENWAAAKFPQRYAVSATRGARTLASSTMIYTGAITLVFLIIHVTYMRFSPRHEDGLYGVVVALFRNKAYSVFYIAAVCVVGAHVYHGLHSAFRSLGVYHPKYTPAIEWASRLFGLAVAAGYASVPLWVMFFVGGKP